MDKSIKSQESVSDSSKKYEPKWESLNKRETPKWFTDAKFGIFIHWGLYSVPAWAATGKDLRISAQYAEWYWQRLSGGNHIYAEKDDVNNLFRNNHKRKYGDDFNYQEFAPMFKAEEFNPDQWADIFKDAGANYVILTSKHHEGYTLWPSKESWNWNSVDIGAHRDLCGDLTDAVKKKGLHMGMYYSLFEWYNPVYQSTPKVYVEERMLPQMKDLVERYEPDLVYVDGEWDQHSEVWRSEEYLAWLFNESKVKDTVAVNDRWGSDTRGKHGGYFSTEYGSMDGENDPAEGMKNHPWEEIRGIGNSFGYNQMEDVNDYLSSEELIHLLIKIVADGGNLCLNVGPTASGLIPVIMHQRLHDIGQWLKVNGDAIYETTALRGKFKAEGIYFTQKKDRIFAIQLKWNQNPISIEGISKVAKVKLMGSSENVKTTYSGNKLTIYPPIITPENNPCDYAWVYEIQK